jgi:hypothetical protein
MSFSTKRPDVEKPDVDDSSDTSDDDDIVRGVKPNGKSFASLMKEGGSSTSLGASCPSDCANGPTGSDQWDLV